MNFPRFLSIFVLVLISTVISCSGFVTSAVGEDDVKCLEGVKSSLNDPEGKLSSWSFKNSNVAFLCRFVGVSCWNDTENRIINLELREMKLSGQVPEPLQYCKSLQKLDLSVNKLSGTIPPQLCSWLPYLVTLDLSNNDLTGSIPPELGNCIYLNTLNLSNNRLSGTIPYQLSNLGRLSKLSVANNGLTGTVPSSFDRFDKAGFAGNDGLCGGPLGDKHRAVVVVPLRWVRRRKTGYDLEETMMVAWLRALGGSSAELDWLTRFRIGFGATKGLAWLHHGCQPPFPHQNICSYVILITRIMDFGLARLMTSLEEGSYVNGDLGELGYIAPKYSSTMVPSPKEDVYELGVVLLELVTGQKPLEISKADEGFKGNLVD
ncbi:hypothetical protein JRO89_XS12G0097700 [Xanthoceras sorbifolium]|uniref:Protein kinase domain-containing protein n=1 Tax=Xanthoceras sorbifolium TaxID=99658 RepID=A0ABQ8HC11_9ROSI|nr:hypothetical protein JRO89_XS12G0097700 [Xanthoceras sorbifolium]